MKKSKLILSLTLLLMVLSYITYPQDKKVIISNLIGTEIDKKENERYKLFTFIENFQSAVIYKANSTRFYANIKQNNNGSLKDTIINLNEQNILYYALLVRGFNNTDYRYTQKDAKFKLDTMNDAYIVTVYNLYEDRLSFIKPGHKSPMVEPDIGFGLSCTYLTADMKPVAAFFNKVENYFNNQGYSVPHNTLNFNPQAMYTLNFYLHIESRVGLEIEAGKAPGDIDIWYGAVYVDYHHTFNNLRWFRPHIAAGWSTYRYYTEYAYGDVVVTEYGGMLDKIVSRGGSSGPELKLGFDLGFEADQSMPITFSFNISRSFLPDIISTDYGNTMKENLSCFRFSAGLKIYI